MNIPTIGTYVRHAGRLLSIEKVQPPAPPPHEDYIFEEVTARCELFLGSELIKGLGSLNDFYGLETSVATAIDDMQEYAKKRGIGPESPLEVRVTRVVSQYRKRITYEQGVFERQYPEFVYTDRPDQGLAMPVETIAWSSKQPEG